MSYQATARNMAIAEGLTDSTAQHRAAAADALTLTEWGEKRRRTLPLSPVTAAFGHALHVSDCAADLRDAIAAYERGTADERPPYASLMATAARELLRAIGEGED